MAAMTFRRGGLVQRAQVASSAYVREAPLHSAADAFRYHPTAADSNGDIAAAGLAADTALAGKTIGGLEVRHANDSAIAKFRGWLKGVEK